jgi:hypothetical protein
MGTKSNVLKGHTDNVNSVEFSRDSMQIVSGSGDNDCAGLGCFNGCRAESAEGPHRCCQLGCIFEGRHTHCFRLVGTRLCGCGMRRVQR